MTRPLYRTELLCRTELLYRTGPLYRIAMPALLLLCWIAVGGGASAQSRRAGNAAAASEQESGGVLTASELPELKCRLHRREPVLDYELRFYAPFWVNIPLRRLYGGGQRFSSTAVIHAVSVEGAEPVRVEDTYELGKAVPEKMSGEAELGGAFALGEGRYEIDWRFEDEAGRSCELRWTLEAKLPRRQRDVNLTVKPGEVAPARVFLFRPEPAVASSGTGLRIKLLMNLDVPSRRRARVRLWQYAPMISGLRMMSRHPALAEFSVVAFSLEEQEILHSQEFSRRIPFPDLGEAIESMSPATVELATLRKGSDLEFLDDLLDKELEDAGEVDAIIFVGADDRFGKRVSPETLEHVRAKRIPVFHFNSSGYLWRGAIGNAVRSLGGKEYRVRQPHELARAVEQLVAEILSRRPQRRSGL